MTRLSHLQTGASALLVFGLLSPATAEGQVLTGVTVDAQENRRLAAVEIRLLENGNTVGVALTDSAGKFRLRAPYPGGFSLLASGLGYDSVLVSGLELEAGQEVHVEVRMGTRPVELAALEVVARKKRGQGLMSDYYYRLDQNRKTGRGIVLDREQLEEVTGLTTSAVLRRQANVVQSRDRNNVSKVYLRQHGRYCTPTYFLNGLAAGDDVLQIPVSVLEGIEIYRGGDNHDFTYGCGMVAVWTRHDYSPEQSGEDSFAGQSLWGAAGAVASIVVLALIGFR